MERNLIFIFVLLTALSMINSMPHQLHKRTTSFGPCHSTPPPSPLTVSIYPDPVVPRIPTNFTVSGKVVEDIPAYSILSVEFIDGNGELIIPKSDADFCSSKGIKCPIPGGTPFDTEMLFSSPNDLPASYEIRVSITNPGDPSHYLGCAISATGFSKLSYF